MWLFGALLIILSLPLFAMRFLKGGEPNVLQWRLAWVLAIVGVVLIVFLR